MLKIGDLVADCEGYGRVLRAWQGIREIHSDPSALSTVPQLSLEDARKFHASVYAVVRSSRPIRVYRFYETAGLQAPYGRDHPSFYARAAQPRVPAARLGGWWSPRRPSLMIDDLGYGSDHRQQDREAIAVTREWNRFDICVEAILEPLSLFYAGRTAPQAENTAFETDHGRTILYGGGAMQFLLVRGQSKLRVEQEHPVR